MSEMVERVAEGMIAAFEAINWRDEGKENAFRTLAKAAMEVMREPNAAILSAMRDDVPVDGYEWEWLDDQAEGYWRAMIDAALRENEPTQP